MLARLQPMMNGTTIQALDRPRGGGLLLTSQPSRSPRSPSAFSKAVMRSHENLHPQYQWSQSSGEGRREGWVWGGEFRGLCQGLVSSDIDTPRLGTNSAERAQTSRTPMSSWRDYVSRRPQEPWKYLDISSPPLPPTRLQIHCIISCGWERHVFKWPETEP